MVSVSNLFRPIPNIVLLGGMRTGKDTVYKIITQHLKYEAARISFGDIMKEMFHQEYPEIGRTPKPHKAYIEFGQDLREKEGEDVFVDRVRQSLNLYKEYTDKPVPFIFTDVRQDNEHYFAVEEQNSIVIRLKASEETRISRMQKAGDDFSYSSIKELFSEPTETRMNTYKYDYLLENDDDSEKGYKRLIEDVFAIIYQIQSKRVD